MDSKITKIAFVMLLIMIPLKLPLSRQFVHAASPTQEVLGDNDNEFSSDKGCSVAIDMIGNVIVTGYTSANQFPELRVSDAVNNGNFDVFIAKYSPMGTLLWSTLFGGSNNDEGTGVAVDHKNNIIVTGTTWSDDFVTMNAYDSTLNGDEYHPDAFVAKFTTNGSLMWSTFLGGASFDYGNGITVDTSNDILVVGTTKSSTFPAMNAYDSTYNGVSDVFISKFNPNGSLVWSTFLGGIGGDEDAGIAIDSQNNIIVTGFTLSDDFPIIDAYDSTRNSAEAFLSKLAANGSLVWSTFLGGTSWDKGHGVAVDAQDNLLMVGATRSDDFPTPSGSNFTQQGGYDVFVAKFTTTASLLWATFLTGRYTEEGMCVSTDSQNNIYVTGITNSDDFTIANAYDSTYNSQVDPIEENFGDSFAAKLFMNGSLQWSTFLGGYGEDEGWGVVADEQDNIYVTGATSSSAFPVVNAYDDSYNGFFDVFVVKFTTNGSLGWSTFLGGRNVAADTHDAFPLLEWSISLCTIAFLAIVPLIRRRQE